MGTSGEKNYIKWENKTDRTTWTMTLDPLGRNRCLPTPTVGIVTVVKTKKIQNFKVSCFVRFGRTMLTTLAFSFKVDLQKNIYVI